MENSQLINILKSLNKKELREFRKFVRSPYFNNRSEVVRFYDAIKIFYPLFNSKNMNEEIIFSKVYPGKKYSNLLMRKLVSLMIKLLMDFYAISSFKDNAPEYNVKMLYKLHEKKLPVMFEKKAAATAALLQNAKHTFSYYESKFNYTSILNGYLVHKNEKAAVKKLQGELDDFIEYFVSVLLLLYIRFSNWSYIYNIKYDLKFYDETMKLISKYRYGNVTLVSINYNMLMLSTTQDEKYFYELTKCRNKFETKLSDMDDFNIYIVLSQFCLKKIHAGKIKFRKDHFELTKSLLKRNFFPRQYGYMEPYFFTSIVFNASRLKEFAWTEDFIESHKNNLDPALEDEIVNYSYSTVEFDKGNFEKALRYLSTVNPQSLYMKLTVKNLLVMVYYELNFTDELISLIDSFRHFLHRDKDTGESLKKRDTVFIKFVSELVRIRLSEEKGAALELKKKIEKSPYFSIKEWLLQKTDELVKTKKRT